MENYGIFSLLPICVTLLCAIFLRRIGWALIFGLITGSFTIAHFSFIGGCKNIFHYFIAIFTDKEMIITAFFLLIIGAILNIIKISGSLYSFSEKLLHHINSKRKVRISTWFIGVFIFFSYYASMLINSSSMRRLSEKNNNSPSLFSYITVSSCDTPSIMLISSWAVFEGTVMSKSGEFVGIYNSLTEFLINAIPYHMGTCFSIFLSLLVAISGRWFSYKLDKKHITPKDVVGEKEEKIGLYFFLIPILSLIFLPTIGFIFSGYIFSIINSNPITIESIISNAKTIESLAIGSLIALGMQSLLFLIKKTILTKKELLSGISKGIFSMIPLCLIILIANSFVEMSGKVGAGTYLATLTQKFLDVKYLPALIFIMSILATIAVGYSWGSIAIIMPVAYTFTMHITNEASLIPIVSAAVISGSIIGTQMIPYSDRIIVNAKVCGLTPLYHAKTVFPQAFIIALVTIGCYIIFGFTSSMILSYFIGFITLIILQISFARKPINHQLIK